MKIGLVVGEASGDILGAGLMDAIRAQYPQAQFEGIGGPEMLARGFVSFFPQDRLAVMGFVDPLKRLPELLAIRRHLKQHFTANVPDIFIGVDSPDFNLDLELYLKEQGVTTAHYVSPSVWAWRRGRVKKIAKAVDLMLTLFPFEAEFYRDHKVPVCCVGHPLADELDLVIDQESEQLAIGLEDSLQDKTLIALLPGSRRSEVERLGPLFLKVAAKLHEVRPDVHFLLPSANRDRHHQLEELLKLHPNLPVQLVAGNSRRCMAAADIVMLASGTASLEAMLLKKPMLIAYKTAPFSYWLLKKLVKVEHIGLPNLLLNKALVKEFVQEQAQVDDLLQELLRLLDQPEQREQIQQEFTQQHKLLRKNASQMAAKAVLELIGRKQHEK